MMLLVWVQGSRGPAPQKWYQDHNTPGKQPKEQILAFYPIPRGQEHLPIDELAIAYPYVHG
jgi:hypothetical protein